MARDGLDAVGGQNFELGKVISTSLAVFGRNIVPFGIITALAGIPLIALTALGGSVTIGQGNFDIQTGAESAPAVAAGALLFFLIFLLTYFATQAAISYGSFQDLAGRPAGLGECIARGLAALPKMIVSGILASIGIGIASLLFVVPGIILYMMWWVFVPVTVVERAGITECFGRSRALTRGHRWGIFGLLILVGIAEGVVNAIFGALTPLLGQPVEAVLGMIVSFVFTAFASVMTAVGYYYLRAEKEGLGIEDIARVFD